MVDSWYDTYMGVVILVRVINGKIYKNMKIKKKQEIVKNWFLELQNIVCKNIEQLEKDSSKLIDSGSLLFL